MAHFKLIDEDRDGDERMLALVSSEWPHGITTEVQLQIAQDGNDAYIDLSIDEVKLLISNLNEFLSAIE